MMNLVKRLPRKLVLLVERLMLFPQLFLLDWRAGRQLTAVQDLTRQIRAGDVILATCMRNELPRMQAFVDYYRGLGVNHFLIVDNGSTDGFIDWAAQQDDVSVWYTEHSYRDAAYGMHWVNDLLRRHAAGHWCVVVDPDEFLVYPYMETRDLRAVINFLEEDKRESMHALLIDAYSDRPLSETVLEPGTDPFELCPFLDRDGYVQQVGWGGSTWIRGGPRMRIHFADQPEAAPALNKIPLIKWQKSFHYRNSMHDAYPRRINNAHTPGRVSLTAALFHFKFVSSFSEKAIEEAERQQHWQGGHQYAQYRTSMDPVLYSEGVSVRYEGPAQLVDLGLMSPATWY